uniref:SNRNP25 ubiquitin-like domain-containing protein n=1 Tax=Apteryx owenii TaxID=8824 RepID=A0A8B9PHS1_APTOW
MPFQSHPPRTLLHACFPSSSPLPAFCWLLNYLKYIWRTYHLTYAGEKLADDRKKLREYGIRNRDEVSFIKKLRK